MSGATEDKPKKKLRSQILNQPNSKGWNLKRNLIKKFKTKQIAIKRTIIKFNIKE